MLLDFFTSQKHQLGMSDAGPLQKHLTAMNWGFKSCTFQISGFLIDGRLSHLNLPYWTWRAFLQSTGVHNTWENSTV